MGTAASNTADRDSGSVPQQQQQQLPQQQSQQPTPPPPPVPVATAVSVPVVEATTTVAPVEATPAAEEGVKSASSEPPAVGTRPTEGVAIDLIAEHTELASGKAHDTMVGIHLTAAEVKEEDESARAPLDVVVVSDLSGSMAGAKVKQLKDTIKLLANELSKEDRVGLVTFESNVHEPLHLRENVTMNSAGRVNVEGKVEGFRTTGMTNLSGGLFAGISQFTSDAVLAKDGKDALAKVRTCLLLTDGQANRGVTETNALVNIMNSMLRECEGLTVHTFGYGGDHNSEMLRGISDAAHGSYYFIENNDEIRQSFGDCLGGLLTVVAQNLEVEIEAVGDATITKVHEKSAMCLEQGKRYTVKFSDLYAEEERDVLVSVKLPRGRSGAAGDEVIRATLRYVDVVNGAMANGEAACSIARPRAVSAAAQTPNEHIAVQRTRVEVASAIEEAGRMADSGDISSARLRLQNMKAATVERREQWGASPQLQNLDEDLDMCLDGMSNEMNYNTKGGHWMRNLASTHAQQRCQTSKYAGGDSDDDSDDDALVGGLGKSLGLAFGAASAPTKARKKKASAYQTSAKRSRAAKFAMR